MQPPALEPAAGSPFKVLSNYHSSQQEWSNIFKWAEGSFHKNFIGKEPNQDGWSCSRLPPSRMKTGGGDIYDVDQFKKIICKQEV